MLKSATGALVKEL